VLQDSNATIAVATQQSSHVLIAIYLVVVDVKEVAFSFLGATAYTANSFLRVM
jgi:hypothetical protein